MPRQPIALDESLFVVTASTINILNERPKGGKVLPHAPRPHKSGQLQFPLSLDEAWLEYIAGKDIKPRSLYTDEQYELHLEFLKAPNAVPDAEDIGIRRQLANLKFRCLAEYDLKAGHIYRKPTGKAPSKYLPCLNEAFRIMAHTHAQLLHCGVRKS